MNKFDDYIKEKVILCNYYLFYIENICFFMSFYFTFTFILQQKGDLWS